LVDIATTTVVLYGCDAKCVVILFVSLYGQVCGGNLPMGWPFFDLAHGLGHVGWEECQKWLLRHTKVSKHPELGHVGYPWVKILEHKTGPKHKVTNVANLLQSELGVYFEHIVLLWLHL
jgi:hypothetical protein